jgi:hypothetical protein
MYADNQYKFVAVLNPKIDIAQLLNALGHLTAGLMAKANNLEEMRFLKYEFQADWATPSNISLYPFIILKAKNNNQLRTLHQAVNNETGILHNTFTDSMLASSAVEQVENTKNTQTDDLIYLGIVLFGDAKKLAALTRKFSIFKV